MLKTTFQKLKIAALLLLCSAAPVLSQTISVFDEILFYDGYAPLVDEPVPDGIIRHRNDLYSRMLLPEEVAQIGDELKMKVIIKAACDNYDRIGNVNLALVPKGAPGYIPADVQRIELGRFITPFMNKNLLPDEVPYTFFINNVAAILKDPAIYEMYDFWVELQVFGVPYAAQDEIAGCDGHIDVFYGTLDFITEGESDDAIDTFLKPLYFQADFNNYNATDQEGTTLKTMTFELASAIANAKLYLITSNHGSNEFGEEYNRRQHYVKFDGVQVSSYKPGGVSCENYREYNTQGNGIYGPVPLPASAWAWNNWCPGNKIPIRTITLGDLEAGSHTFSISVPTAEFVDEQGNIPLSVYLQGENTELQAPEFGQKNYTVYPNPVISTVGVYATEEVATLRVYNMMGQLITEEKTGQLNLSGLAPNIYTLDITFASGVRKTEKIIKN